MLEEALERGWLPAEPERVRKAMDAALTKVRVYPTERLVFGTFKHKDDDWRKVVGGAAERDRHRVSGGIPGVARTGAAAASVPGLVPELLHAFRAEMGVAPEPEARVAGLIEPELLGVDAGAIVPSVAATAVEDAEEVVKLPEPKPTG